MATIKKVNPYYSRRDHRRVAVHHDRSDCPVGRLIHSESLAAGTGRLPRCRECAALDDRSPVSSARSA
jgi:hypothetical protein